MTAPVGLWTTALDAMSVPQVTATARAVELQGWASLWFGEATGRDAFSTAWLTLAATERLHVGTGIASIWARDAMSSAATARTLRAAHQDRFHLGLGVSHRPLVSDMRGHQYAKPLAAMRSYLTSLAEPSGTVPGERDLPPVVVAALGPKMTDLSGELAQGAITFLTTPIHTQDARQRLGDSARLVVHQAAVLTETAAVVEWRRRVDRYLKVYLGLENYRHSFARQGFEVPAHGEAAGDELRTALVPNGLGQTLERIQAHLSAGADEVVVQVLAEHRTAINLDDCARLARHLL